VLKKLGECGYIKNEEDRKFYAKQLGDYDSAVPKEHKPLVNTAYKAYKASLTNSSGQNKVRKTIHD
jgi:hypothetical protein